MRLKGELIIPLSVRAPMMTYNLRGMVVSDAQVEKLLLKLSILQMYFLKVALPVYINMVNCLFEYNEVLKKRR